MKAADLFPFRHELRAGTMQAVRNLPPEHLEWVPPGGVHSIIDWLRHIAEMEEWWLQAVIAGRRDVVLRRKRELVDFPGILRYLEETRAATEQLLQTWPVEKLAETRPLPPGYRGMPQSTAVSLHWILAHLFNHEVHHRAQIYLYLRLMGVEPPPS